MEQHSTDSRLSIPKYHRRIMCFDTETTGLMPKRPRKGEPYPPDEAYPYIIQISWIIYNVFTAEIEETVNEYIRLPESVPISPESIKVHGITREIIEEKGKSILQVLAQFYIAYMKCDCIVAHNLHFDSELVRKEMWRNRDGLKKHIASQERVNMMCGIFTKKFNSAYHIDTFCTMINTVELCNIDFAPRVLTGDENGLKGKSAHKKFPRLSELYSKLFGEDAGLPADLHNSIIDVLVCLRCFLKVRGVTDMLESDFQRLVDKYSRTDSYEPMSEPAEPAHISVFESASESAFEPYFVFA